MKQALLKLTHCPEIAPEAGLSYPHLFSKR